MWKQPHSAAQCRCCQHSLMVTFWTTPIPLCWAAHSNSRNALRNWLLYLSVRDFVVSSVYQQPILDLIQSTLKILGFNLCLKTIISCLLQQGLPGHKNLAVIHSLRPKRTEPHFLLQLMSELFWGEQKGVMCVWVKVIACVPGWGLFCCRPINRLMDFAKRWNGFSQSFV